MNAKFLIFKTMKTRTFLTLTLLSVVLSFTSCSSDDDASPQVVNEEEVITTVIVELSLGTNVITLQSQDLDGDGPNAAVITPAGGITLNSGTSYTGTIRFLNELESPAEDITIEVEDEDDEHQVFFTTNGGLDVNTAYTNFDGNGNPLGTNFTVTANTASSGTLTFTLIHEPTKPNTGLSDAGGETDIEVTFDVTIN